VPVCAVYNSEPVPVLKKVICKMFQPSKVTTEVCIFYLGPIFRSKYMSFIQRTTPSPEDHQRPPPGTILTELPQQLLKKTFIFSLNIFVVCILLNIISCTGPVTFVTHLQDHTASQPRRKHCAVRNIMPRHKHLQYKARRTGHSREHGRNFFKNECKETGALTCS
jgi:hypothetical protein